jgi:hypothetical protein
VTEVLGYDLDPRLVLEESFVSLGSVTLERESGGESVGIGLDTTEPCFDLVLLLGEMTREFLRLGETLSKFLLQGSLIEASRQDIAEERSQDVLNTFDDEPCDPQGPTCPSRR